MPLAPTVAVSCRPKEADIADGGTDVCKSALRWLLQLDYWILDVFM